MLILIGIVIGVFVGLLIAAVGLCWVFRDGFYNK